MSMELYLELYFVIMIIQFALKLKHLMAEAVGTNVT